jgi:serine/threonine-protein kinase
MSAVPDPRANNPSDKWFGPYQILGKIGYGGMGSVYLARANGDAAGAPHVALKVVHPHLAGDERFIAMLHDEAWLASRISHPNVVAIIDVGAFARRSFLVMQYVEGCTLWQLLRRHQQLLGTYPAPALVVRVVRDMLAGLHAAHTATDAAGTALHLVHRDVSCGNILVGVDGVSRVTDFGIAKARSRITHTMPGVRKGKYNYMAPEQVTGAAVDHRADLFSAGVVLYNALTGLRLFEADSEAVTLHNVLYAEILPPSQVGFAPPGCFDEICMRALARDVEARYQSATEMAAALQDVAAEHDLAAGAPDVARCVGEMFREQLAARREAMRSGGGASVAIGLGGAAPPSSFGDGSAAGSSSWNSPLPAAAPVGAAPRPGPGSSPGAFSGAEGTIVDDAVTRAAGTGVAETAALADASPEAAPAAAPRPTSAADHADAYQMGAAELARVASPEGAADERAGRRPLALQAGPDSLDDAWDISAEALAPLPEPLPAPPPAGVAQASAAAAALISTGYDDEFEDDATQIDPLRDVAPGLPAGLDLEFTEIGLARDYGDHGPGPRARGIDGFPTPPKQPLTPTELVRYPRMTKELEGTRSWLAARAELTPSAPAIVASALPRFAAGLLVAFAAFRVVVAVSAPDASGGGHAATRTPAVPDPAPVAEAAPMPTDDPAPAAAEPRTDPASAAAVPAPTAEVAAPPPPPGPETDAPRPEPAIGAAPSTPVAAEGSAPTNVEGRPAEPPTAAAGPRPAARASAAATTSPEVPSRASAPASDRDSRPATAATEREAADPTRAATAATAASESRAPRRTRPAPDDASREREDGDVHPASKPDEPRSTRRTRPDTVLESNPYVEP